MHLHYVYDFCIFFFVFLFVTKFCVLSLSIDRRQYLTVYVDVKREFSFLKECYSNALKRADSTMKRRWLGAARKIMQGRSSAGNLLEEPRLYEKPEAARSQAVTGWNMGCAFHTCRISFHRVSFKHKRTSTWEKPSTVFHLGLGMTLDDENEGILVQIQEEQRQFPQRFARRLHQVGKRAVSLPDEASGRNVVEIVFVFPVFVLKHLGLPNVTLNFSKNTNLRGLWKTFIVDNFDSVSVPSVWPLCSRLLVWCGNHVCLFVCLFVFISVNSLTWMTFTWASASSSHGMLLNCKKLKKVLTVNPEYFVGTQFSYPGLSDLSYTWNFRTAADRCRISDLLCTFRMHFIFVTEAAAYEIYENKMHTKYSGFTVLASCYLITRAVQAERRFKGKLHSNFISSVLIDFFHRIRWWRSEVEIRMGRRLNGQRKIGMCYHLWRQWCHLAIMYSHTSDSKCSWTARIRSSATCRSKPITPGRIQDHSAALNSWRLAPVRWYRIVVWHSRFFGHFRPSADRIPVWILTSDLLHRTLQKRPTRSGIMILECNFQIKSQRTAEGKNFLKVTVRAVYYYYYYCYYFDHLVHKPLLMILASTILSTRIKTKSCNMSVEPLQAPQFQR